MTILEESAENTGILDSHGGTLGTVRLERSMISQDLLWRLVLTYKHRVARVTEQDDATSRVHPGGKGLAAHEAPLER